MEIYKSIMIQDLPGNQFVVFNDVNVDIVQHINEGGKTIRAGQGSLPIAIVGGKSYFSVHCLNIADEVRNKFANRKVNVYLDIENSQKQIFNSSIKYSSNDIIIETQEIKNILIDK